MFQKCCWAFLFFLWRLFWNVCFDLMFNINFQSFVGNIFMFVNFSNNHSVSILLNSFYEPQRLSFRSKKSQELILSTEFCSKGAFINDLTQFLIIFNTPYPHRHFLVLLLQYCRHKIFDTPPLRLRRQFIDEPI